MLFAQDLDLTGATVVLDSDGGSVLGAIALGRAIRSSRARPPRSAASSISPAEHDDGRAPCCRRAPIASRCAPSCCSAACTASVPPEARVMVHQIWLGDRRDDPTAANYSAEDLVLVQRDIGQLAQYTVDMGGRIDLLDLALRIPPWEPMHALTRDELRRTRLATERDRRAGGRHGCRLAAGGRATGAARHRWRPRDRDQRAALGHGG